MVLAIVQLGTEGYLLMTELESSSCNHDQSITAGALRSSQL